MQTVLVICISMRDTQGNGCFFHFVCLIVIATLQLTINQCSATILCCRCLLVYSFLLVGVWQFTQYLQGRSSHALFTYSAVVWTCDEVGWPFVLNDNDAPLVFHNRFSFSQLVHVLLHMFIPSRLMVQRLVRANAYTAIWIAGSC
jgi:hypothetical protein